MVLVYRPNDAAKLREQITIALHVALQETLKKKVQMKVNSSSITHTDLIPEGEMFTIVFQVVVHESKEKPSDVHIEP